MRSVITILLTVTSLTGANYPLQQSILLDPGVSAVTIVNTATGLADARPLICAPGMVRARITFTENGVPPAGTPMRPAGSSTYPESHGNPATVSVYRNLGDTSYFCEAVDIAGASLNPRIISSELRLPMIEPDCPAPGTFKMPLEVVGMRNYVVCASVTVGVPGTNNSLRIKADNLGWKGRTPGDDKAEVKLNNGPWVTISCANFTPIDEPAPFYGCIGSAVTLREGLISDALLGNFVSGINQVRFRFGHYGLDGVSSGFRIVDIGVVKTTPISITGDYTVSSGLATVPVTSTASLNAATDWIYVIRVGGGIYGANNGNHVFTIVDGMHIRYQTCENHFGEMSAGSCSMPDGTYHAFPTTQYISADQYIQPTAVIYRQISNYDQFVQDDPALWTAPVDGDPVEGAILWNSASLVVMGSEYTGFNTSTPASCSSCHRQGAFDMVDHGASNWSIRIRGMFHGLTWQQGTHIAAYARGQGTTPPTGRWWNGPFQPGPGLSALTTQDFRAGAGSAACLVYDEDMKRWLAPGGVTTSWGINQHINWSNIPVYNCYTPWHMWLAEVWPDDYVNFAVSWASSPASTCRDEALATVISGDVASFKSFYCPGGQLSDFMIGIKDDLKTWVNAVNILKPALQSAGAGGDSAGFVRPSVYNKAMYAASLLATLAVIDVNATLGFEDKLAEIYVSEFGGSSTGMIPRGYIQTGTVFSADLHFQGFSMRNIMNETAITWDFLSNSQYEVCSVMNAGNFWGSFIKPWDIGYYMDFLFKLTARRAGFWILLKPHIIALQESQNWPNVGDSINLLQSGLGGWFSPFNGNIYRGTGFTPLADQTLALTQVIKNWTDGFNKFTPLQWCAYFVSETFSPCGSVIDGTNIYAAYYNGQNDNATSNGKFNFGAYAAGMLPAGFHSTDGWTVNQTIMTDFCDAIQAIYTHTFGCSSGGDMHSAFTSWMGKPGLVMPALAPTVPVYANFP